MDFRELRAAGVDAIRVGGGERVAYPHALHDKVTMRALALAASSQVHGASRFPSDGLALLAGIRSAEFSSVLAEAMEPALMTAFDAVAGHRRFCSLLTLPDYRVKAVPAYDVSVRPLPVGEGGEITSDTIVVGPGLPGARVERHARNLFIPRSQIVNDEYGRFLAMGQQVGASGARMESEHVAAAMGENPVMDDGGALFDAARLNVIASALDATTLGQAMAALRNQPMPGGGTAGLALAHLVVEPGLELAARKLVHESGISGDVRVTALPGLATGRWFALADPQIAPTIGVVSLRGAGARGIPIRLDGVKAPFEVDAASLRITADIGATLLSPHGIIRGGA